MKPMWCLGLVVLAMFVIIPAVGSFCWNTILIDWGGAKLNPFGYWQCVVVGWFVWMFTSIGSQSVTLRRH